jgi:ABC-type Fe3+-hydroxamate transport system, periplasmic component
MDKTKLLTITAIAILAISAIGAGIYVLNNHSPARNPRALLSDSLEVYGNANGDWTINDDDIRYVEQIIRGDVKESKFADSNQDGKIDSKDIEQIKALSNGTAKFVYVIDGLGDLVKVNCSPERIYALQLQNAEIAAIMGVGKNVVAGGPPVEHYADFLLPGQKESMTYVWENWEIIAELNVDMYMAFGASQKATPAEKLPGVDVIYMGLYEPITESLEKSLYGQGILKMGYIFNCKERAEGYLGFLIDIRDRIQVITSTIPENERVNVLTSGYSNYFMNENTKTITVYLEADTTTQAAALAGARNVAESLPNWSGASYSTTANLEWLDAISVDWITLHYNYYDPWGVSTTTPPGGYTIKDSSEMYKTLTDVATRPMLENIDKDQIMLLPQEFRNGSHGGIILAAYLAKAFYPEYFKDFDPDEYMKEYLTEWLGIENYDFEEYDAFIAYGKKK